MDVPAQMIRDKLSAGILPREEASKPHDPRPPRLAVVSDLPEDSETSPRSNMDSSGREVT